VFGSGVLKSERLSPWLWLALAVSACIVSWFYMHRVLMPWETYVNVTKGRLKDQKGDLYPRWVGTRELLLHGRDPYGPEVSREIQIGFYGHPIVQSYDKPPSEIVDEQRFAYPIYVVFLLAPTVNIEFADLQEEAVMVLTVLIAITVWLWIRVVRWRPSAITTAAVMLFVIASPQVAQGLRLRQLGLLVAFLLALAAWSITRRWYALAGFILAISTIKPQMVLLVIAWFLLWSLGDIRKRWALPAAFGISLGILAGVGAVLLPSWPLDFLRGIDAYRHYFPITSLLRLLLGDWAGGGLSILVVVALFAFAWKKQGAEPDSYEFVSLLTLFLIVSSLVLPIMTPSNQVLLLLPAVFLLANWRPLPRAGRIAFTAIVAWPSFASVVLLVRPPVIESTSRLPLVPSVLVLLFPFLLAGLLFAQLQTDSENPHIS
jgi:hypothetical protein